MSTSGAYGSEITPGSRLTVITVEPFSVYQGANIDVKRDFPEPAVPVKKIAYTASD